MAQPAEPLSALENAFDRATAKIEKQELAARISALGSNDRRFLDYLIGFAKPVSESDMPYPFSDRQGKFQLGSQRRDERFLEWCATTGTRPDVAVVKAVTEDPQDIRFLARARNNDAAPVLLRALRSPNFLVMVAAAEGLGALGKPEYFDPLVAAAKAAPRELGSLFARSILEFKTEQAQSVAGELVAASQSGK